MEATIKGTWIEVTCPRCGRAARVEGALAGRKTSCDLCQEVIRVPATAASLTVAPEAASVATELAPVAPMPPGRPHDARFAPPARPVSDARDLEYERHLVALAIWQRVWCVLGLIAAGLIFVTTSRVGAAFGAPVSLAVKAAAWPFVFAVTSGALGHYLARYHHAARLLTVLLAGASALLALRAGLGPVTLLQVAFDVAVILVLMNPRSARLCTPEYHEVVARTPGVSVPWWSSPFFWIPALMTALVLFVALLGGAALLALR